jgi:very-short-patch-repair endonuclease
MTKPKRSTPKVFSRAKYLRREQTPAEGKLWAYLRSNHMNGISFKRQHPIGGAIVDFCSVKYKLVIEVDDSQHIDQEKRERERSMFLEALGYRVIRFGNNRVMNDIQGVVSEILIALADKE